MRLHTDPYEFRNLAASDEHIAMFTELKSQLAAWRLRTNDPLLKTQNLMRLKKEVDACVVNGEAQKKLLQLSYPNYFFSD